MERLYEEVRDSAYEIIERKGATYYGIAMAVARIAESIVKDEHAVLPVSVELQGEYGLSVWHSASRRWSARTESRRCLRFRSMRRRKMHFLRRQTS